MRYILNFGTHIRTKLLIAFLVASLGPVLVLTFFSVRTTRQALIHNAEQALISAAGQTANSLDAFINANLDAVRTEAQIPALIRVFETPSSATLDEATTVVRGLSRKDTLNIISYGLIDLTGKVVVDTISSNVGSLDEASASYIQQPLQSGLPYVSPVEFSPESTNGRLSFSSNVRNNRGEIVGILRVRYRASVLQLLLVQNTERAEAQSFAMLIDDQGLRLADSRDPQLVATFLTPLSAAQASQLAATQRLPTNLTAGASQSDFATMLAQSDQQAVFVSTTHPVDSGPNQVAAANVKGQPWKVAFALPQDVFLQPIQTQVQTSIFLLLILVLVAVAATVVLSQILTTPLIRLTKIAAAVRDGDLSIQAPVTSKDEIGTLAATFNTMTLQLAQTMEGLEQRVNERTHELRTALETQATQSQQLQAALDVQEQLNERVVALSMPIIPVQAGVLVVPLVGAMDTTLSAGQTRLLHEVVAQQAHTVMIDVTGMVIIDELTGTQLIHMAQAVRMLGATLVLVGIRPELAQTLISLGIDLHYIETHATLQKALQALG